MAGIDIDKAFNDLRNPLSEIYKGGMLDSIEWVDESQSIYRMLVNIPFCNKREFVNQI